MRRTTLAATASLLFATPAAADHRAPLWGPADRLAFVSDVTRPGAGASASLCLHIRDQHAVFIPYKRTVMGYALSSTNCRPGDFHPLSTARLDQLKAAGFVPASITDTPRAPVLWSFEDLQKLAGLLLILFVAPWLIRRRYRSTANRLNKISGDPLFFDVLLSLMFHVARTDGIIEEGELLAIRNVYQELTGAPMSPDATASKFTQFLSDEAAVALAKRYRGDQAEIIFDAVVLVAGRSGGITREKMQLIRALNSALALDKTGLRELLTKAAASHSVSQAA